jgi:peptidyl-prolyl cis-trans isomerase SurA
MEEETEQKQQSHKQKDPMSRKFIGPIVALFIVAVGGYWLVSTEKVDLSQLGINISSVELAAKVNGQGIEQRLYDTRFEQTKNNAEAQGQVLLDADIEQLRKRVLDDMVNEQLLVQYGKEQGITAEENAIEEQYQQIVSQFGSEEAFQEQLTLQNATLNDVRKAVGQNIITQQVAEKLAAENNIEISEEEMQQVYDEAVAGGAEVPSFEDVKGEIENFLRQQKTGLLLQELITKLRAEANIEIIS